MEKTQKKKAIVGVCPECKVREGDSSRKRLYKCPYCDRYFCKKHLSPRLAITMSAIERIKDRVLRDKVYEEWRKLESHPDWVWTREYFSRLEKQEEERREKIFEILNKLKEKEVKEKPEERPTIDIDTELVKPPVIEEVKTPFKIPNLSKSVEYLVILIILMFGLGFISPIFLFFVHPNMQYVVGNPKPLYFYDIDSSCSNYEFNIVSSLNHFSQETGVKFIRLESPLALLLGGISYSCTNVMSNFGAAGEAESGFIGTSLFIIAWNNIRLSFVNEEVILHETLHVMGFGHSENPASIMYPYGNQQGVENELKIFIQKWYAKNPLAYFNIIPLNLLDILLFSVLIFFRKKYQ